MSSYVMREYQRLVFEKFPLAVGSRCEFDLLFYNSQSQANWSRKNGQALPAVRGEINKQKCN